ncbi:hypothetical protein [Plasmodium yoelii yoelii]|uniref:Uncharacterized protein n=1 Tax=Plasmodium yoelii yoelii TaxID=73239 RepID=Q7R8W3_PLAYO|nr:hypothetical protein [Plasmodium yoelii yoelii]
MTHLVYSYACCLFPYRGLVKDVYLGIVLFPRALLLTYVNTTKIAKTIFMRPLFILDLVTKKIGTKKMETKKWRLKKWRLKKLYIIIKVEAKAFQKNYKKIIFI